MQVSQLRRNTANWKGCPVYKAKLALKQTSTTVTQRINQRTWNPAEKVTRDKSYVKVASSKLEQANNNNEQMSTQTKRNKPTIQGI